MKKVFLVQPGYLFGNEKKSAFLPYAAATLAAYAFSEKEIAERYVFSGFICFFEEYETALQKLKGADVVGFSNYVWNYTYNCELAKRVKRENPQCTVIFGGHQISPEATPLSRYPYVDYMVFGEGEASFAALLRALPDGKALCEIPGIACRAPSGEATVTREARCSADLPSPYLSGTFDALLCEYPDVSFTALFETNRGCPYSCAYCDWGTAKGGVRLFPMERIRAEIEWFASHKIEACFAADANFGLFPRDEEIADLLIEAKRRTGYPQHFDVTYAKSEDPRVLRIACALVREKMSNGPAISFQSLNPDVLKAIGRENMPLERFVETLKAYEANGLRPYSELILGLPEETYGSFVRGIGTLLALGQHSYLDIFRCEILSNSVLSKPQMREKYRIRTVFVPSSLHHVKADESKRSYGGSEIVVATSTMTEADMLRANLFAMTVQSCHFMGLTKYIAMFLFREKGVPYETFYEQLSTRLAQTDAVFAALKGRYEAYLRGEGEISCADDAFGGITWFPEELFFLRSLKRLDGFYEEIRPVAAAFLPETELLSELLRYQRLFAVTPAAGKKTEEFSYDFYGFFRGETPHPVRRRLRVTITPPFYLDWAQCARYTVWYGRRRSGTDAFCAASDIDVRREEI